MGAAPDKSMILIVDDMPTNIKILGELLKSEYRIRLATNGKNALKIAGSFNPPDLILLDIIMTELDGYGVCRQLKADRSTKSIPVIFIIAMDQEDDETKGLSLGAVDYITKPFRLFIVKARVKTHLEFKHHPGPKTAIFFLPGSFGIPRQNPLDNGH